MGRLPCKELQQQTGLKKGPWTNEEDQKLVDYIQKHGHGSWRALPKLAGKDQLQNNNTCLFLLLTFFLICHRFESMWEELQTEVDELLEA